MAMKLRCFGHFAVAIALLAVPRLADATPSIITFNATPPVALGPGSTAAINPGFLLQAASSPGSTQVVIDNGLTPPDSGAIPPVEGDLASQTCLAFLCASDGGNAAYVFRSGGFSLTRSGGGGTFSVTGFDAAIASNAFSRATRFTVEGLIDGSPVASATFLLLPGGYGSSPSEDVPDDAAAGSAEAFQTLSLTGFNNIDGLVFSYVGALSSDPAALTEDWGFLAEFAIDNIDIDGPPPVSVPEPASALLLLGGLAGLFSARRAAQREQKSSQHAL